MFTTRLFARTTQAARASITAISALCLGLVPGSAFAIPEAGLEQA